MEVIFRQEKKPHAQIQLQGLKTKLRFIETKDDLVMKTLSFQER